MYQVNMRNRSIKVQRQVENEIATTTTTTAEHGATWSIYVQGSLCRSRPTILETQEQGGL